MLESLDRKLIFETARELGYPYCRIYAERTLTTQVELHDKDQKSRYQESGGISLELSQEGHNFTLQLRTNQFTTAAVMNLLGREISSSSADSPSSPNHKLSLLGKKLLNMQLLVRKINLDSSLTEPVRFCFEEQIQDFELCSNPDRIDKGQTTISEVKVNVSSCCRGNQVEFCHEISTSNVDDFELQLQALPEQIQKRIQMGSTERWPLPQGEIAIGWSSQSIAKLTDCFIRGFEGDLFLKNFSFLSTAKLPLQFQFKIEEFLPRDCVLLDHEGTQRKPILIFDGQKPRSLATDSVVSNELEVSSTGHSRRASFDSSSSIGFWHPVLKGLKETDSILEMMNQGIWIEELEVRELDLITGHVTLHLSQANLVHQSQIGESIEPFNWTVSLSELMGSLINFSNQVSTNGLFHIKQKQRIFTEYTTPAALSHNLNLPGTVPKSHYW